MYRFYEISTILRNLSRSPTFVMTFVPGILVLHVVDQVSAGARLRFKLVLEAVSALLPLLLAAILVELARLIRSNVPALHLPALPVPLLVIVRHRLRVWGQVLVHVLVHRVTVTIPLLLQFVALQRGKLLVIIVEMLVLAPFLIPFLVVIGLVVELVIPVLVPVIVVAATSPRAPIRVVLVPLLVGSRGFRRRWHVDVEEHRPRVSVVVDHVGHEDLEVQAAKRELESGSPWEKTIVDNSRNLPFRSYTDVHRRLVQQKEAQVVEELLEKNVIEVIDLFSCVYYIQFWILWSIWNISICFRYHVARSKRASIENSGSISFDICWHAPRLYSALCERGIL